jgi:SAM-dependent methyltransferase
VDELTYQIEAEIEANHWWFVTRRKLLSRIIRELGVAPDAPILDLGTSTGTNLRMLKDLDCRNAIGLDKSPAAIRFCAEKGLGRVEQGDVCDLPFADEHFACVLATDIVEHVDDDVRALSEICRVLAPGGTAVITVPAFESLWGVQDDVSHHKRRYRKRQLEARLRAAGLEGVEVFYFNYLLFFPIWLARQVIHYLRLQVRNENLVNTSLINRVLTAIFTLDVYTARWVRAPFGVSILAIARRGRRAGVGIPLRVEAPVRLVRPRSAAAGAYPRAS